MSQPATFYIPIPGARVSLRRIEPDSLEAPLNALRVRVPIGRFGWTFSVKLNTVEVLLLRFAYREQKRQDQPARTEK